MTFELLLLLLIYIHGIYNYIPETNQVSSVYSVAAAVYLQSVLRVMLLPMLNVLYFYISTSRSVQYPIWLFFPVP